MPTDPETQRNLFKHAVTLLGGPREAARELEMAERSILRLSKGEMPIHDGHLRDIAAALLARADECRALERRLSPAFAANLLPDQPRETGNRAGGRKRAL